VIAEEGINGTIDAAGPSRLDVTAWYVQAVEKRARPCSCWRPNRSVGHWFLNRLGAVLATN